MQFRRSKTRVGGTRPVVQLGLLLYYEVWYEDASSTGSTSILSLLAWYIDLLPKDKAADDNRDTDNCCSAERLNVPASEPHLLLIQGTIIQSQAITPHICTRPPPELN